MLQRFATAISCIDGRVQKPVIEYMQASFNVDYVDMITEAGPNKILSENMDTGVIESLKKKVAISVHRHNSQVIAVVGHYDCAGNPESEEAQKGHLQDAVKVVASWGFPAKKIVALWLDNNFLVNPL